MILKTLTRMHKEGYIEKPTNIKIHGLILDSLLDGNGVNLTIFFAGCHIHCPGCHNESLQDPESGREASVKEVLSYLSDLTTGIVLSGGEPTEQPLEAIKLARTAKHMGLKVTLYTGLTLEQLKKHRYYNDFISVTDEIKAGPFIQELRSTTSGLFGSTNQKFYSSETLRKESLDDFKTDL